MSEGNGDGNALWFALRTRSRHEKVVRDQLSHKGIEYLLPTINRMSQWKDRKKRIEIPLFSGYCFARFAWTERIEVLGLPGVVKVVGSGTKPEPVPDVEIDSLKTVIHSAMPYDAHPYVHEGMRVEVARGPLRGVRGIIVRKEKHFRLVISVDVIKQAAAVEIDAADIVPV